ncbi:MAG: YncE family protein [Bacteroidales bacterium]|nr:YncE family protein [Bacteroidales bacterium]MDY0215505.1 YncE family protein [Bacteroidales bacterium]
MKKTAQLFFLIFMIILVSCRKEEPPVKEYQEDKGVFICNEGNFMSGNSSLSFFNTNTKEVSNQVFYNANGFPLGDVCQSMKIFGNYGFIVINNSGKIMVINTSTFKHIASISNLPSPRYVEIISSTKAYVSDYSSHYITIIDPSQFTIGGNIPIGATTEAICKSDDFVFVSSWSFGNKIYKIDSRIDKIVDSVEVVIQPNSIVFDKNKKLWVLSDGGFNGLSYGWENAALSRINPEDMSIEAVFTFENKEFSPTRLQISKGGDTLYYLNGGWGLMHPSSGVCQMSISDNSLPQTALIQENGRMFFGLGIHPSNGDIYISDAKDYVKKSVVYRYTPQANLLDSFRVDIGAGYFCFKE